MDLTITALPENALSTVLRNAESNLTVGADIKATVVDAALDFIAEAKVFDVRDKVKGAVDMHVMIFGAEPASLVNVICDAEPEFAKLPAETRLGLLVFSGDDLDVDATLHAFVKALLPAPLPMNRGKWLAKLGIVQAHLDVFQPGGTPPAAPPAAPAPDMASMLGGGDTPAPTQPLPPPPPVLYGGVATGDVAPEMDKDKVREAILTFADALTSSDEALAQRLGVSRSTLYNMTTGKTKKAKLSLEQARVFLAEIDVRIGKLNAAAEIFRQVR